MADEGGHAQAFLAGGGEMGARMRAHDWAATPLGAPGTWPEALRTMVSTVLNSALLGTVLWGPDLRLLYNDAYAPALAERHPAALGRPLAEVWADIWPLLAPSFLRVLRTGEPHFETRFPLPMTRGGRQVTTWWNYSVAPVRDGEGTVVGLLNQALEITGEVEAEATLRQVADALPLLVALVDRTLTYRFANAAYEEWFGLAPEEVVGRTIPDLTGPEGYAARREGIERALSGTTARFDLDWPRPDGRRRLADVRYTPRLDVDGAPDGFYILVQDVTAARDATAVQDARAGALTTAFAERTAERDRLWETTTDLMGTASLDGRLTAVNPAWTRLLGWSEAHLLATPFAEIIDPDDHVATGVVVERLRRGETVTGFVDRVLTADGGERSVMWTATPDVELDTGLFHVVGRDMTELFAAEEQLRQSQKMEAVGQLTGGLAHDFNNLLAGISGSLEMMDARINQGRLKDVERYMAAAQGATRRAAALTHRLLAFSRRQTLQPRATNVNNLVHGMLDLVQRTVGPGVQVEFVGASGAWPALVDPSQLENALLNLCLNARDAMPGGGRITVETGNRWLDRNQAKAQDMPEGQYLSLCVSDTGTGMPPEVVAKAFDPFFTTKPLGQGTGLGLSMIYGFARQSGGQVRIYSEVGEGTMVCLYLPRHRGEADADEVAPDGAAAPFAADGETVLVVDDEPTVRMLVADVLGDLGYTAIEAADGAGGLRVLQSDARIDLLVTDIGLPGEMNGRQMVDAARAGRPDLKVLFITGFAENALLNNGQLEPGMAVLTKPFAVDVLAARIRELIVA